MTHVPLRCDVCGAETSLVHNIEIYGKPVGEWEWHVLCSDPDCGAHVETKPGTSIAVCKMSTPQTRQARVMAHRVFDKLWSNSFQRRSAYAWLAQQMKLSRRECHIKLFSYEQCHEVVRLVKTLEPTFPERSGNESRFEQRSDRRAKEGVG